MPASLLRPLVAACLLACALPALAQTPPPLRTPPTPVALPVAMAPAEESVVVELRVVTVGGADGRETVAKLFEAKAEAACCEAKCCEKPAAAKTAFLTEGQLLAVLEKFAADRTTTIMQAPRITADAGKPTTVNIIDTCAVTNVESMKVNGKVVMVPTMEKVEIGQKFTATATPSADGKFIKLTLAYRDKQPKANMPLLPVTTFIAPEVDGGKKGEPIPFTQFVQMPAFDEVKVDRTVTVPNGGTVAVHAGTQKVQVRSEFGPPVLSQIPYMNRLFKNVGIAEQECDVVVLATARRVASAEEQKAAPAMVRVTATIPASAPTDLLAAYHAACARGDKDAAMRLAVQALAQDPTCFGRK